MTHSMTIYDAIKHSSSLSKITDASEIPGWFNFAEAYDYAVAQADDNDVFIEVGAFLGRSTAHLAQAIKRSGKKITLWVIDPFKVDLLDDERLAEVFPNKKLSQKGDFFYLFQKFMKDLEVYDLIKPLRMTSDDAYQALKNVKASFIFIDGLHTDPYVTNDINNYSKLLTTNGLIGGDDYLAPDVKNAVQLHFGENNYFVSNGAWPFWMNKKISS